MPAGYTKAAKAVAERQAALAGYRLADAIQQYLKCAHVVALLPANTYTASQAVLPKKIGAAQAKNYYDETMVVRGKVVRVTVRPNVVFLGFDKPFPNTPFTAVIFEENVSQFGDLQRLQNQSVEVSGTITDYHDMPEIVLESTNQLTVVGSTEPAITPSAK